MDLLDHAINVWNRTTQPWWLNRVYHGLFFVIWTIVMETTSNELVSIFSWLLATIHLIAFIQTLFPIYPPKENT